VSIVYRGQRTKDGIPKVFRIEEHADEMNSEDFLPENSDKNLSFFYEWGYAGPGSTQLAFDILYDYTKDPALTKSLYEKFAQEVICNLNENKWRLGHEEISPFILSIRMNRA
jgi:hypothetical protein